jgi:hypothetical protein
MQTAQTAATIVIHLPVHRRATLEAYQDRESPTPSETYDQNIGRYVDFLKQEARTRGFEVRTDQRETDPVYTLEERGHEEKKRAHDWLEQVPDFWEWLT